ncbi:hypothetical protein JOM56_014466 [Amanita muscaria]
MYFQSYHGMPMGHTLEELMSPREPCEAQSQIKAHRSRIREKTPHMSTASALHVLKASINQQWQELMSTPKYTGHSWLRLCQSKKPIKPRLGRPSRFYIRETKNSIILLTRFTRAITSHAPIGEYRKRFFPELEHRCTEDGDEETRNHILSTCTKYQRDFPDFPTVLAFDPDSFDTFLKFIVDNPSAFTFGDSRGLEPP